MESLYFLAFHHTYFSFRAYWVRFAIMKKAEHTQL